MLCGMGRTLARGKGFTLLELMIVLAVAAIVLAIGVPNFSEFRRNSLLSGVANDFLASLQLGRTEAIKRQARVSICPTADPTAATPTCSTDPSFQAWLVFADADANCELDSAENLLRIDGLRSLDDRARVAAGSNGSCLAFGPSGFRTADTLATTRVVFCDERGVSTIERGEMSAARGVEIAPAGRGQIVRQIATLSEWGAVCPS